MASFIFDWFVGSKHVNHTPGPIPASEKRHGRIYMVETDICFAALCHSDRSALIFD
jgi:hypothetical protein